MQKYSLKYRKLAKLSHWELIIFVSMAKSTPPQPAPSDGTRSKGLVDTVNHECLIWPDIADKTLRELIKLSPAYSPAKASSLDTSFEAAVVAAEKEPEKKLTSEKPMAKRRTIEKLTIADATALTSALANNIIKDPSGYEAHYTALMRQVWRHLADNSRADTPVKEQASYTELNQLIHKLDSISPRDINMQGIATAANVDHHMRQDINLMAKCITQISIHMNDKDTREEAVLNGARERLKGVRVIKDRNSQGNIYILIFSPPADPKKTLLEHTQGIREYLIGHDIRVGDIKNNGIVLVVEPEKDSLFDRVLQALGKEGKMIR